ncbi:PREDICTED: alpha-taxilin [Drosophila arizonae]|uniref:Alpha-taxilin n=1 Tax=Drosophila arizonae TaxID=7263 RepID=A0ABM1Q2A0_DROAR|nr:PREDICTED: alpha-taxilin [Drosophila arizonae]
MERPNKNKRVVRDEKQRELKLEDMVLRSLDECTTNEDKLKMLLQRHVESEKTVSRLTAEMRALQRHMECQQREKEQVQRELNKSVLMRDKLQEVCREQQRILKSVKNESMLQIKVEEERRKESQTKFQSSLNEVQKSLSKNNEENVKLRDYNTEMTKKLKLLAEQYQAREKHLEKLNEQVQLESQLHQAKLTKAQVEAAMEKEILTKENQIGLEKLLQAQRSIKDLTEREQQLKEQLNIYTAKYDEFQQSLKKSNEVFGSYKIELEKMSKHTKKIEKEALGWRQKYEKANGMVIELATEKQQRDQQAERLQKQVDQLQKLLRALQLERTTLHQTLREKDIPIPAMPQLPPEPEPIKVVPINTDSAKMELMTRNCAELKQTLANLQNQMKLLTTNDAKIAAAEAERKQAAEEQQRANNIKRNNKKKAKSKAKAAAAAAAAAAATNGEADTPRPEPSTDGDAQAQAEAEPEPEPEPEAEGEADADTEAAECEIAEFDNVEQPQSSEASEGHCNANDADAEIVPESRQGDLASFDQSEVPALIDSK